MSDERLESPTAPLTRDELVKHVSKLFRESQGEAMHVQLAVAFAGWSAMSRVVDVEHPTADGRQRHLLMLDTLGFLNAMVLASALGDEADPADLLDQIRAITEVAIPHYRTIRQILLLKAVGPVGIG